MRTAAVGFEMACSVVWMRRLWILLRWMCRGVGGWRWRRCKGLEFWNGVLNHADRIYVLHGALVTRTESSRQVPPRVTLTTR